MNCQFQKADAAHCECIVCGRRVRGEDPDRIYCACPGRRGPSVIEKAANYAKAVTQHVLTGSQTRTDEEVSELMQLCESCEHYDQQIGRCGVCGCRCNKSKSAWLNKLRMASQHCPKGKW